MASSGVRTGRGTPVGSAPNLMVGTVANALSQLISIVALIAIAPIMIDRLGSEAYAIFAILGPVTGFASLLDLGISSAATKFIAELTATGERERLRTVLASATLLFTAIAFVVAVGLIALAPVLVGVFGVPPGLRHDALQAFRLSGEIAGAGLISGFAHAAMRGRERFTLLAVTTLAGTILNLGCVLAVLLAGGRLAAIFLTSVLTASVMLVVNIGVSRHCVPELAWTVSGASRREARALLGFSGSVFMTTSADQLTNKTDEIVIAGVRTLGDVTPFVLARRLVEPCQMLAGQFSSMLMPTAARLAGSGDRASLRELVLVGTRVALGLVLPFALGASVFSYELLAAWVGPEHAGRHEIVRVLAVAAVLLVGLGPSTAALQAMNRHRAVGIAALAFAVANVVLSVILVSLRGAPGAALATLIAALGEVVLFGVPYAVRVHGLRPSALAGSGVLPALVPLLPTWGVLLALKQGVGPTSLVAVIAAVLAGAAVYAITYLHIPGNEQERALVRAAVRRTPEPPPDVPEAGPATLMGAGRDTGGRAVRPS